MIAKRKFNHTSAGLLSKFLTRYNDIDGYWAPGVLYTEARSVGNHVELDVLDGAAQPSLPSCQGLARTWAIYLRQALGRHDITPDALASATISITFGLPPVPKRPGYVEYGDPFVCTLRLVTRDGRNFTREGRAHCKPHEEFAGSRSTRRSA